MNNNVYGFRPGPIGGDVLTPEDFASDAMENSFSFGQAFTSGAADAFTTSTSIGLGVQESSLPELAREPVQRGVSRAPLQYRYDTEEEAAAKGETLLDTEEKQRLSPYHRDEIPHEKGMTESRLKILSENYDLSQVRRYYASKRPVAGFFGGITGTIADPINFIPVVGQAGTALAVGKVGRVAGRAAVGAVDATISTAVFDAASLETRKRLGDEMDGADFLQDLAFSALAGSVIGTTVGLFSRKNNILDERAVDNANTQANRVKAALVFNDATDSFLSNDGNIRLSEASKNFSDQVLRDIQTKDELVTASQLNEYRYSIGVDGTSKRTKPNQIPDYAQKEVPAFKFEKDLRGIMLEDLRNSNEVVAKTLAEDAQGVYVGRARKLDKLINEKKVSIEDVAKNFEGTREFIRQKYGDKVVLYRWDAPDKERAKDALTVYMADKKFTDQFKEMYGGKREMQPYLVSVDDIVSGLATEKNYREFVVKIPEGNLVPYTGKIADAPLAGQTMANPSSRQYMSGEIMQAMRDDMAGLAEMQQAMFGKKGLKNLSDNEVGKLRDAIMGGPPSTVRPFTMKDEAAAVFGKEAWQGRTNYSEAAPSPEDLDIEAAYKSAEASVVKLPKANTDTLDAEIKEAKEDGIDIETGENDLKEQLDSLLKTMDENDPELKSIKQELEATKKEFEKETALGEVLDFARTCFLR